MHIPFWNFYVKSNSMNKLKWNKLWNVFLYLSKRSPGLTRIHTTLTTKRKPQFPTGTYTTHRSLQPHQFPWIHQEVFINLDSVWKQQSSPLTAPTESKNVQIQDTNSSHIYNQHCSQSLSPLPRFFASKEKLPTTGTCKIGKQGQF